MNIVLPRIQILERVCKHPNHILIRFCHPPSFQNMNRIPAIPQPQNEMVLQVDNRKGLFLRFLYSKLLQLVQWLAKILSVFKVLVEMVSKYFSLSWLPGGDIAAVS